MVIVDLVTSGHNYEGIKPISEGWGAPEAYYYSIRIMLITV